uniref:E3 SUMO-protein ligase RanBP2 n=1 Tax=Glossina brevipalpis TaxID=37001 RepID=A0A1A9WPQ8_9MUSC
MFKNKKDLDAHVTRAFSRLRSETERDLRGFTIAKLYYKINEFATAKQYLNSYLSIKKDNAEAHKLLGQVYKMLKIPDKALESFQCSLQLNTKQPDVLTEICRLLLEDDNVNSNKAKYWCELAESEKIQDDAVFELRLKLVEVNETESLLKNKIMDRPNCVQLRIHLVRYYIEKNQILDAFNYVYQLEMSQKNEFSNSIEWYNVIWLALSQYEKQPDVKKGWDYWLLLIICLERQVQISFTSNSSVDINETTNYLFKLDQYLFKFSQASDFLCTEKGLVEVFFDHYRGQLLLHIISLIFKHKLLKNDKKWDETVRLALPLLLLAFQVQPLRSEEPWIKYCDEIGRLLTTLCQREGSFRCAQVGRILLSCVCNRAAIENERTSKNVNNLLSNQGKYLWASGDDLLACVRKTCADGQWRCKIFTTIFFNSDQKTEQRSSLLVKCHKFCEPIYEMPSYANVERYEEDSQYFKPESLQHAVYLCLGRDNLALVRARYFNGLNFSTQNLNFCGAESLNQLDVDSFMYAATLQVKRAVQVERETCDNYLFGKNNSTGKPLILPFANMQSQLCTDEQAQWWNAAYKVYKNLKYGSDLTDLKIILQNGIEAVRGVNGPRIDLNIMFKLGQIFKARAQITERPVEKSLLEARTESIYKTGLNLFKMHKNGILEPFDKYFKYARAQSAAIERELTNAAEDAVTHLAKRYFKRGGYEDLIEDLANLQLPFASYWQAEAYLKLDGAKTTTRKTRRLNLEKATECLNQTLALLKSSFYVDTTHPLNTIIHQQIKKVKQLLATFLDDSLMDNYSSLYNNSSFYEGAENDVCQDSFIMSPYAQGNLSGVRRETTASAQFTPAAHNQEIENIIKQMASTLILLKEEILENFKPELQTVAKDIVSMKDRIGNLEEAMKKARISSIPPSRDDASKALDDFYLIEDALRQQLYQQPQTSVTTAPAFMSSNQYSAANNGSAGLMTNSPFMGQQPRLQTPNPMHIPPNAFSNTMFPSTGANYPLNFYGHNQPNAYLTGTQGVHQSSLQANQRNVQLPFPYIPHPASGGLNFNMTSALNSQPVEKGPPANVVITSSDPLPTTNSITLQSPQQPTLSVTIPSHHLKSSILGNQHLELGGGSSQMFNSASTSISTMTKNSATVLATPITPIETFNKSATFTFKPEVEAAAAAAAAAAASSSLKDKNTEIFDGDINKSDPELEYDARPDFKGIIPLPEEIVVCTGEEDEEVMFCHRAKLFRHVAKEWKERGIGDIKILKNKEGAYRILMRRDQTHKICANHKITPEMSLTIPKDENRGFIWGANDFADEELRVEKFFVRFKLSETASTFQEVFNKAQRETKILKNKGTEKTSTTTTATTPFSLAKSTIRSFATSTPTNKTENVTSGSNSLFGIPNTVHSTVADLPKLTTATFSPLTNFTFGNVPTANTFVSIGSSASTVNTNTFVGPTSSITSTVSPLSSVSTVTNTTASINLISNTNNTIAASPFASIFNNLNKSTTTPFSISTPTTTIATPSLMSKENATSNLNKSTASDVEDDFVSTKEFQPVIPLPDIVEVNTGEENEIVLFEHRAKLLRFDKKAGEWKEKGLGNIKLLQDKDDIHKLRLLMRREQVHKLCCNQRVYKDTAFTYMKNSETALSWAGQDFSDNELVAEMLTVRFKTPEVCKQFHKAILEAQDRMSMKGEEANVQSYKISSEANSKKPEKESKDDKTKQGFGDAFKPKIGSWTCQACYISNESDRLYCIACDSPKDNTVPSKTSVSNILAPGGKTFNFGFSATVAASTESTQSLPIQSTFTFRKSEIAPKTGAASSDKQSVTDLTHPSLTSIDGFGDQFKPKAGSWVCSSCYISNVDDIVRCMACETPKNNTITKKVADANVDSVSKPTQKFSFGFPNTSKSEIIVPKVDFGFNAGPIPAAGAFTFATSLTTSTSLSTIAATTTSSKPATFTMESAEKPHFWTDLPLQNAEALNLCKINTGQESASDAFSLNRKEFNFTLKPKSPGKTVKSPLRFGGDADAAGDEDTESEYPDEEESSAHFIPVIPLPEKIKVKTGEEDEEILYVHRAKLYRFTEGEWKERGIGNVKILRHKETKKLRVVMRRDQVLKICLNHALNEDVDYKRKDHKSWLFVVNDFSEEAIELQKLSLRFKNKEIAENFMEAVKRALNGSASPIIETVGSDTSIKSSTSLEATSSDLGKDEENKKLANDLKLPLNFFAAPKTDCTGCRGCDPEKFNYIVEEYKGTFINEEDIKNQPSLPMVLPSLVLIKQTSLSPVTTSTKATPNSSISFKKKLVSTFTATADNTTKTTHDETTAVSQSDRSQENSKAYSAIFGGLEEKKNINDELIFSGVANLTSGTNDKTQSVSIFGGTGNSLSGGSIFGQKPPIFGNSAPAIGNTTRSIFGSSTNNSNAASVNNSIFGSSLTSFTDFSSNKATPAGGFVFEKIAPPTTKGSGVSLFGGFATTAHTSSVDAGTFTDLSKTATASIDFASLAAKASKDDNATQALAKTNEKPRPGVFIGLTDENAFASLTKRLTEQKYNDKNISKDTSLNDTKNNQSGLGSTAENDTTDENYDPQYEPIIELPDEIVVTTGEEEEMKRFGERATLFRWDDTNKEWKERGVGELKILFHPAKQTYRMVMRREQIYKLILNQVVNADFSFNEMNKNPKSFLWGAMNYAECPEGVLEKLAVRFKNIKLAEEFSKQLKECIAASQKRDN